MKKLLLAIIAIAAIVGIVSGRESKSRSNKTELARNIAIFNNIVKELESSYVDTLNPTKMVRTAIDAMLMQIDPYTEYYSEDETEELYSISSGEFGGIGAYIMRRDNHTIISQLENGAPAQMAGLRPGDRFVEIDGEAITSDMNSSDVSKRLRGQAGTDLTVKVLRPFVEDSIISVTITRQTIAVNQMPYYGIDSTGVGYIQLTTFNDNSAQSVRNALLEMKKNPNLRGVVLDLRNNGGGVIDAAIGIVGLFVPKGTEVVSTKGFDKSANKIYKTTKKPIDTEIPLVVMINSHSASASEIVAGALQDLDRAVIIGERSFGKGLVQSSRTLPYNGLLKITTARYYIPSGRLIQAIDYSHRNADGTVDRIPDSLTTVWHTAAGREVRDGCGISPDIEAYDTVSNRLLYNIVADFWAFDYANRFAAQNQSIGDADSWEINDSIFNDFKSFIDPARFKYDRQCELGINYLRTAARIEGYDNDSIMAQIDILERMMRHDLDHDLDFNREHIIEILDGEISRRYFNEGEVIRRNMRYDVGLDTARVVILDSNRYNAILSPQK